MMTKPITVLIVDDHAIVRDGINALLDLAGDISVAGEAANGSEALLQARKLRPDVVVMDISMPVLGGIEATRRLRRELPQIKVLALTQHDDKEHVISAIEAGAFGFISKTAASAELLTGIRAVHRGDSYISPLVARFLIEDYQHGDVPRRHDTLEQLTDRERDVLKLIAEGYTGREIAEILIVSPKTVEGHRTRITAKLGLRSRVEIVKFALRRGIITF
jgi:two-component system, NarL family, response regulator NreC